MNFPRLICSCLLPVCLAIAAAAKPAATDRDIAARFAPIFYQALGDKPRGDYITNFDFDGDWRGDNNWIHTDDSSYKLRAYIYFSISETASHYFVLYAVFHPRDYKGGETKGRILSEIIGEGARRGEKYDPTGWMEEATVAHENDMEGCLLVIEKKTSAVAYVETLHHNNFLLYAPKEQGGFQAFKTEGQHPLLYIEPKGHGIESYDEERIKPGKDLLKYSFTGVPADPEKQKDTTIGYDLLPLQLLWNKAQHAGESNTTYGNSFDYGVVTIALKQSNKTVQRKIKVGKIGSAFLGKAGGQNMAKPPWGWFDKDRRGDLLGSWFFNPAAAVKRDFKLDDAFATAYTRLPFWATN